MVLQLMYGQSAAFLPNCYKKASLYLKEKIKYNSFKLYANWLDIQLNKLGLIFLANQKDSTESSLKNAVFIGKTT